MTRVATSDNWNSALMDLMGAQRRQYEAQRQVSDQRVAVDLKGFGRTSETLTAFNTAKARLDGHVETNKSVAQRLETQNLALERVADAAVGARQQIADALAVDRAEGMMQGVRNWYLQFQDALNAKHQGRHLFSGARVDTPPFEAETMADLAAAATVDELFVNDDLKAASRLDDATTVETGFLANEVGRDLAEIFRDIQVFENGPNGPLTGKLTDAQRTFLEGLLSRFETEHDQVLESVARNGALQKRVETNMDSLTAQSNSLETLIGEKAEVDMAEAITRLQQAQVAVQASAQILSQLKNTTLLDLLR